MIGQARAASPGDAACRECHEKVDLRGSAHEKRACMDCHADAAPAPGGKMHVKELSDAGCANCHYKGNTDGSPRFTPMDDLKDSIHGAARAKKYGKDAPTCRDCHGAHGILPKSDPRSRVNRLNIPATCARCHADGKITGRHRIKGDVVRLYLNSIHGKAVSEAGLTVAAVCDDCHGIHDIRAPSDPRSSVYRPRIPETCRKCHLGIYKQYVRGIHGKELAKGNKDVPVCTDCHGEHSIRSHKDPDSRVYPAHLSKTCTDCHDDVKLARRYGLPVRRSATYAGTYHGVAVKYGDTRAANCASCHGAHDILPPADAESSVNLKNLAKTCGKCHPNAGSNFAKGPIHVEATRESNIGVFYVRKFYTYFIPILIGCFVLYILVDIVSRARRARRGR